MSNNSDIDRTPASGEDDWQRVIARHLAGATDALVGRDALRTLVPDMGLLPTQTAKARKGVHLKGRDRDLHHYSYDKKIAKGSSSKGSRASQQLARLLRFFEMRGWIDRLEASVAVLDPEALRSWAETGYERRPDDSPTIRH